MTLRHRLLDARFRLFLRHVRASRRPIVCGPWRSEVGFEVLYWLPFLAQLRADYGLEATRLVALSRGGASSWYDMPGQADLYSFLPIETVRLHTIAAQQRQQSIKQYAVEPWERHVVALAASSLGLTKPIMLHPSWMYGLLDPAWRDLMPFETLATYLNPRPFPPLPLPDGLVLPPRFVAVRLYARATMESHDDTMIYLKAWMARLAKKQPVVFLSNAVRYDDHADLVLPSGPNQVDLAPYLTPQTNLAVQAAVLQRAALFVGTYGGLAQLALRLGIPTVAAFTSWQGTAYLHLDLTHRLALASKVPFTLVNLRDAEKLEALL